MFTLLNILVSFLSIYIYIIVARAVISWFSPSPYNPIWRILCEITEPPLSFIRGYLRRLLPGLGGIDFSPIILILLIHLLIRLIMMSSNVI